MVSVLPKPNKNPGAGALVQAQIWYRDPASTSNQTTSLSNAVEFFGLPAVIGRSTPRAQS